MDGKNGLVLWILGGTGILFLYSAYKAKSPAAVLMDHLSGGSGTAAGSRVSSGPEPFTGTIQQLPPGIAAPKFGPSTQLTPNTGLGGVYNV